MYTKSIFYTAVFSLHYQKGVFLLNSHFKQFVTYMAQIKFLDQELDTKERYLQKFENSVTPHFCVRKLCHFFPIFLFFYVHQNYSLFVQKKPKPFPRPNFCTIHVKAQQVCAQKLESVLDFLIKLDMKPCVHLVETSFFH